MKHSMIDIRKRGGLKDPNKWSSAHKWMLEKMDAFDRVFRPLVAELDDGSMDEDS